MMKKNKNFSKTTHHIVFVIVSILLSFATVLTSFFLIFKKESPATVSSDSLATFNLVDAKKQLLDYQTYYTEELDLFLQEYQYLDVAAKMSFDDQKLVKYLQQQKQKNLFQVQKQIKILPQIKINDNDQINKLKSDLTVINHQYNEIKKQMDQFNDQNYFLIARTKKNMYQQCECDYLYLSNKIAFQNAYFQGSKDAYAKNMQSQLQNLEKDVKLFKNNANQFISDHQQSWFTVKLTTLNKELSSRLLVDRLDKIIDKKNQYQKGIIDSWSRELEKLVPTMPNEHSDLLAINDKRMTIIKKINNFNSSKIIGSYNKLCEKQQEFNSLKKEINDFSDEYNKLLNQKIAAEIKDQKDLLIYVQEDSKIVSYFAANNFSVPYENQTEYLDDLQISFKKELKYFTEYYRDSENICPKNEENFLIKLGKSFIFNMNYFKYADSCQIFSDLKKLDVNQIKFDNDHLLQIKKYILQLKQFYYLDYYRQSFETSLFSLFLKVFNYDIFVVIFIFFTCVNFIISLLQQFSKSYILKVLTIFFSTLLLKNYFFHHNNQIFKCSYDYELLFEMIIPQAISCLFSYILNIIFKFFFPYAFLIISIINIVYCCSCSKLTSTYLQEQFNRLLNDILSDSQLRSKFSDDDLAILEKNSHQSQIEQLADFFIFKKKLGK